MKHELDRGGGWIASPLGESHLPYARVAELADAGELDSPVPPERAGSNPVMGTPNFQLPIGTRYISRLPSDALIASTVRSPSVTLRKSHRNENSFK